jgi:hypothetical protein
MGYLTIINIWSELDTAYYLYLGPASSYSVAIISSFTIIIMMRIIMLILKYYMLHCSRS